MGQLNVTVDDVMLAGIDRLASDRLASERGVNRQELVRALIRTAMSADGGFTPQPSLRSAADAPGLAEAVGHLRQLAMDLDRALRDQDRREAKLTKALSGAGQANRAAMDHLAMVLREGLAETHAPLQQSIARLEALIRAEGGGARDGLALAELEQAVAAIGADVDKVQVFLSGATRSTGRDWIGSIVSPLLAFLGVYLALTLFFAIHQSTGPAVTAPATRTIACADDPAQCSLPDQRAGARHRHRGEP